MKQKKARPGKINNLPVNNPGQNQIVFAPKTKKIHWWRIAAVGIIAILAFFSLFIYIRINSFVDNTFNGRNETSLLTQAPLTTEAPLPIATSPTEPLTTAVVPTQAQGEQTPIPKEFQPTSNPVPFPVPPTTTGLTPTSIAAINYPEVIRRIKQGEQISMLVAGYGGGDHDGAYLTDTILEITYDPLKNAVTMVNIPRDLFVFIPYGGPKVGYWGKINSAFSYIMLQQNSSDLSPRYRFQSGNINTQVDAAANLLKDLVEQVTGTKIDYWVTFSFDGFRKFIDAIGGIDVNIDTTFDDYEYPANDDANIDASVMHIHFDAGLQHLQGEKAIEYARSRKSLQDGNDFSRSKRQMKIISAVKEKATSPDIMFKVFGLMDALQGNMRTSFSLEEAKGLMAYYQGEGRSFFNSLILVPEILSNANFLTDASTSDGAYILYPDAGQTNYTVIQNWLKLGREFPQIRVEGLRVQVQNGSGQQGAGLKLTNRLTEQGIDTLTTTGADPTPTSTIIDYSGGESTNTLKAITALIPGVTVKTMKKPPGQLADIIVVVGKDYTGLSDYEKMRVFYKHNESLS